ncbi:MAG: hypothetical protein SFV23_04295 [Planctomycetaceae bacterium]|nr:hypothetical protein [Planctomycetaceae bacterium]
MSTAEPASRTWKEWWRRSITAGVWLGIVYTLSIGPMFWTWFEALHFENNPVVLGFYMPLVLACDFCPPFGWLVNWYVNLWIL